MNVHRAETAAGNPIRDGIVNPADGDRLTAVEVTDEMVERFRAALIPGYIVWCDGKRLNEHDARQQIERGLLAALEDSPRA